MSSPLLEAAFAHHVWATLCVIDACLDLRAEELETNVPGTRGPIVETLRHVVGSDAFDLFVLTGDPAHNVETERMPLSEVRSVMERSGAAWIELVAGPLDADAVVREVDENDGFQRWAPVGLRLAGSLEHGTDHRSQICTAITTIGVTPPRINAMDFGLATGRSSERMPGA